MKRKIRFIALILSIMAMSALASRLEASNWSSHGVVFVAHRGGIVPGYPENTLLAYRQAIAFGVHAIEIDLRGTKDGKVVIMHDETVDRTTNGSGKVSDLTFTELRKLDAGRGERVPTYEEVLQLVAGTGVTLLLDIKRSQVLDKEQVVRLTEEHAAILNIIVGARSLKDLRTFRELNPNLRTLGFIPSAADIDSFVDAGVDIVRLWPKWIYAENDLVKKVHNLGRPVWTTAGDAKLAELKDLIQLGVNGILLDSPKLLSTLNQD